MTNSEYEMMMVNLAGGLPNVKPVVQKDSANPVEDFVVVHDDDSFRISFLKAMHRRGAVLRLVG